MACSHVQEGNYWEPDIWGTLLYITVVIIIIIIISPTLWPIWVSLDEPGIPNQLAGLSSRRKQLGLVAVLLPGFYCSVRGDFWAKIRSASHGSQVPKSQVPLMLGPLHTRPRAVTMKLWEPKRKVFKGRPNTPPNSCSVVTDPQV